MTYSPLIERSSLEAIRDISPNVPNDRIYPYIREAQELDIATFLGDELYSELMTQKAAGTLTADNVTLIDDYLKRPLSFYAYARMLEGQPVNVTRFGVVRKETDFSENLSVSDLHKLADRCKKTAQAYIEAARKYLNDNYTLYPLWASAPSTSGGNWGLNISSIG